jgi:hypothetical protein
MYYAILFSQILDFIPHLEFAHIINEYGGDRYVKNFSCWDQLVTMLFFQFRKSKSLLEICSDLATCLGKLVHLYSAFQ